MLTHLTDVLINTGLPRETAAPLAASVVTPPPGSIAAAELPEASAVQLVLLAAIVAATDVQQTSSGLARRSNTCWRCSVSSRRP